MSELNEQNLPSSARDFSNFKKTLQEIGSNSLSYYGQQKIQSKKDKKTSEEIEDILLNDNEFAIRKLSRDYYSISGIYRRLILYFATLLTYDIAVVPKFKTEKVDKKKTIKTVNDACYFIDSLDLKQELPRIMTTILKDGVYYGLFKECENGKFIFQDLLPRYCRTRYKSPNNLPVLEFDLTYFINYRGMEAFTNIDELQLYPKYIQQNFKRFFETNTTKNPYKQTIIKDKKQLENNKWLIIPESLGVVFYFKDTKPIFASAIKAIQELNDYKGLEKSLDEQELKKILVAQIPMNDDGELQFTLEEAAELHKSLLKMLKNNPDVDVLTTFTDTDLLNLQDSSQANRDNLEKMERSVYNEAGVSRNLFATDSSASLEASIKVDAALAINIIASIENFLNYQINKKFEDKKIFLEVSILPITHYNREEISKLYIQGAQYGYSKIFAGISLGVKQSNLINLITFENDCLELSNRMLPLQSSYTTSGKPEEPNNNSEGGAPKKENDQKNEKTLKNEESE